MKWFIPTPAAATGGTELLRPSVLWPLQIADRRWLGPRLSQERVRLRASQSGAGNLLGAEQSGHITAVGFELYCQLLKQSVGTLKGEKVKSRVEVRVALDFLGDTTNLPENYTLESQQRIEIYRKLAQATDKAALEALHKELRDRFGPLPPAVDLLLAVGELKILASEKNVTVIEVKEDKLMLTRNNDFITLGGKFPRLAKKEAKGRLKEIKKLLLAV
jgi:transcription-repair coupling factor (superfamily II helicase)